MERAKKKKLRNLRVIATNIFMGVSIVAIAGILTLFAMGYSLSRDGGIEQAGLIQIKSNPDGATVQIDGETQSDRTGMNKMLSSGEHKIVITKPGYDTWSTTAISEPGLVTAISWVRLFPLERTVETVHTYPAVPDQTPLRLTSVSPDKYFLLTASCETPLTRCPLQLIDIHRDNIEYSTITIPYPDIATNSAVPDNIAIKQWSEDHNKFILQWQSGDYTHYHLIDTTTAKNHLDLSTRFQLNFTDLQIANPNASKIWALENGNLRLIDSTNQTISDPLAVNIEKFSSHYNQVAFISRDENNARLIGTYKEGEQGTTTIEIIPDNITSVHLATGSNWREKWLAYTLNGRLIVRTASDFPSHNTKPNLKTTHDYTLEFTPSTLRANSTGQLIVASSAEQTATIYLELGKYSQFAWATSSINWLDEYLLWSDQGDTLAIIDWNGENYRQLATIASDRGIALTQNNRWLYYFTTEANGDYVLHRERL